MEVSGMIRTTCPPDHMVKALRDADNLLRLLPEGSKLEATAEGRYAFTVTRKIGPIRLTLPGEMTLTPVGKGPDQTLSARATHIIGGKVDLDLKLHFDDTGEQTRIAFSGDLEATGLAGKILRENRARANSVLKAMLTRLKMRAEALRRQAEGQAGA